MAACGNNPYLEDDEGAPHQSAPLLGDHPDNLSLPYAQGTKVRITLYSGSEPVSGWQLRSDSAAVLSVDGLDMTSATESSIIADCTATGAGSTILRLVDETGAERHHAAVQVAVPDTVHVLAHGPLRLSEQTQEAALTTEVSEARVLTGGQGVFALVYFHGADRVYGRGILQFDPVAQVTVVNQTSPGGLVTDFMFVNPMADGDFNLSLRLGGAVIKMLPGSGVPDSQIGSFGLFEQHENSPKDDEELWMQARAQDMSGRDIQGVYASWTLDGVAQLGPDSSQANVTGDLYRYHYATGNLRTVSATHGMLKSSTQITASKGTVYDTTYLGCAMGGRAGASGSGSVFFLLALTALGVRRARRRLQPAGTAA